MGNAEAIAAVNHWRGQCLDNFARAEKAILSALVATANSKIHEAASHRTRDLALLLKQQSGNDAAIKAAKALESWSLREKQRNQLAHGCFTVRAHCSQEWALVNEVTEVKKNVVVVSKFPITKLEADALLKAIIGERKDLEGQLKLALVAT